jgi:YidC/Oxa1 family membrane protein insertase
VTLDPLYRAVAWVIVQIHHGLSYIFPADSGAAWAGSIILLTVLMRILIFPLFVKQINASRKMQELNPQVQALRKKYKNDKQRMNQEVMKLYQEAGANPLSGCLPLLVQFPVFISLFNVLNKMANAKDGNGSHGISPQLVESAQNASIFGASISDRFLDAWGAVPKDLSGLVVTGIAVIISSVTTYFSVKASMARQPAMEAGNPMATAQKMMVYLAPIFAIFGLGFPLGVLLYWMTSNTWTLAQTHYIHKRYPITVGAGQDAAASNGQRTEKGSGKSAPATGKTTAKPSGKSTTGKTTTGKTATGKTATGKTAGKSGGAAGKRGKAGQTAPSGGLLGRIKKQPEPEPEPEPESKPKVIRQQPVRQSRSKRSGGSRKR